MSKTKAVVEKVKRTLWDEMEDANTGTWFKIRPNKEKADTEVVYIVGWDMTGFHVICQNKNGYVTAYPKDVEVIE